MDYFVGRVDEIPTDKPKVLDIDGVSIGVVYTNGNYYAIRNQCPHRLAPICKGSIGGTMLPSDPQEYDFGMPEQVIRCPWHGWEFDLETGKGLFGTSDVKLRKYPVVVKDDEVYVTVKQSRKRKRPAVQSETKI